MNKIKYIYFLLLILSINTNAQQNLNQSFMKRIENEFSDYRNIGFNSKNINNSTQSEYYLVFNQYSYINSNLPNFENKNGLYFPKGYGSYNSWLFALNTKNLNLTIEPQMMIGKLFSYSLPQKQKMFSVLNDVPIIEPLNLQYLKNTGIELNNDFFSFGFGNWNQWWGPGIHNSLVLSNNSRGYYHYYFSTGDWKSINSLFNYKFRYSTSSAFYNNSGTQYFLSNIDAIIKYNMLEFGITRHIISGGYSNILWGLSDAASVLLTNKNIKYWDDIFDFYLLYNNKKSGLIAYVELGYPNRSFNKENSNIYRDKSRASNIGFRKYGAFGNKNIAFGFEYTKLLLGKYYNTIVTSNWYDNINNNYMSYKGRRWAAHSGTDSDDLFGFIGYINKNLSLVYSLNLERHGVTYNFPPEVKFESIVSLSYKIKDLSMYLDFEREYFEHYGFVDSNENVWNETFEIGSIQRTNTILFLIEYRLF